jgi:hypothetical protein
LSAEKKVMMKQWAKREMQIEWVMSFAAGLYGDLQGIVGKAVGEVEGLESGHAAEVQLSLSGTAIHSDPQM